MDGGPKFELTKSWRWRGHRIITKSGEVCNWAWNSGMKVVPQSLRPWFSVRKGWSASSDLGTYCCTSWRSFSVSRSCSWVEEESGARDWIGAVSAIMLMLYLSAEIYQVLANLHSCQQLCPSAAGSDKKNKLQKWASSKGYVSRRAQSSRRNSIILHFQMSQLGWHASCVRHVRQVHIRGVSVADRGHNVY